jgi:hypothetical protein
MRALLIGLLTVAGIAIVTPISVSPVSAQGVTIETPIGGVRVGPQRDYDRDYDRRRDRETTGYRTRSQDRGCRTITVRHDDGSVRKVRRCD